MPIGILVALIVVIVAFLLVALAGVGAQKAPARNTLIVVSVISGFVDSGCLWDMVSMGTLVAFAVVSIAVPVLRAKGMSEPKGFQVPFGPYLIPVLSVLACLYIIRDLPAITYRVVGGWMAFAIIGYFSYGLHKSRLNQSTEPIETFDKPAA